MKTVRHSNRPKVCAARREWHTFFGGLEKKNVVLCVKTCACAPWICQEKKRKYILGCTVLYLSVFPCTHRNIEGILSF